MQNLLPPVYRLSRTDWIHVVFLRCVIYLALSYVDVTRGQERNAKVYIYITEVIIAIAENTLQQTDLNVHACIPSVLPLATVSILAWYNTECRTTRAEHRPNIAGKKFGLLMSSEMSSSVRGRFEDEIAQKAGPAWRRRTRKAVSDTTPIISMNCPYKKRTNITSLGK